MFSVDTAQPPSRGSRTSPESGSGCSIRKSIRRQGVRRVHLKMSRLEDLDEGREDFQAVAVVQVPLSALDFRSISASAAS